ncbi:MAG TPA: protein MauE [Desulfobacteraceae bacterium]|nr:protein MauE [Desulfobacteraceae bacterium]
MVISAGKQKGTPLNSHLKRLLGNSWIELAIRWIMGLTFIYASYHKIVAPADFAKIIYGYDLFPNALINLIAIAVPFIEFILGLSLILGFYPQSAALIFNGLLFAYTVVLSINLIRGYEFDCGCFAINSGNHATFPAQMLIRNLVFLALGLNVFLFKNSRRLCIRADK